MAWWMLLLITLCYVEIFPLVFMDLVIYPHVPTSHDGAVDSQDKHHLSLSSFCYKEDRTCSKTETHIAMYVLHKVGA